MGSEFSGFTGDYDWFFEGFTLYIALQTALKLKLIRFQGVLNTLERVYNSYFLTPTDSDINRGVGKPLD